MSHLTEEQFEDILQGNAGVPAHVDRCPDCRARLTEKRALARRVRQAFSSVQAGPDLTARIRADIAAAGRPRTIGLYAYRHTWSALAAAAVVAVVALLIGFHAATGSQARAAQAELVGIHRINLGSVEGSENGVEPDSIARCLESRGCNPALPCTGSGVCNCCTREFRGRSVVSYLVKGPSGPISIVVVPHQPRALGLTPARDGKAATGRAVWQGACENCNMASVRVGEYSYCALGRVSQKELAAVLDAVLP